jgi:hypothetical protein
MTARHCSPEGGQIGKKCAPPAPQQSAASSPAGTGIGSDGTFLGRKRRKGWGGCRTPQPVQGGLGARCARPRYGPPLGRYRYPSAPPPGIIRPSGKPTGASSPPQPKRERADQHGEAVDGSFQQRCAGLVRKVCSCSCSLVYLYSAPSGTSLRECFDRLRHQAVQGQRPNWEPVCA